MGCKGQPAFQIQAQLFNIKTQHHNVTSSTFSISIILITTSYSCGSILQLSLINNNIVQITLLPRRIEEFESSYR